MSTTMNEPGTAQLRPLVGSGSAGFAAVAVLSLGAAGLSLTGFALVAQLLMPLAALLVAGVMLKQQQWNSYIAFVLGLWLVAPELRRFVDWQSVYQPFSLINITPALVCLLALPWVLVARRQTHRSAGIAFAVAAAVMTYAFAVGVLRGGFISAAADVPTLVGPLVFGLFVLLVPTDDVALRRLLLRGLVWGGGLVAAYAVVQFLVLPAWDAQWMYDSGVTTLGKPEPKQFRAFGTLGTAYYLAPLMVTTVLMSLSERRIVVQLAAAGAALAALGISQVRGSWLAVVFGVIALLALGRLRVWRVIAVGLAAFLLLAAQGSALTTSITDRFDETRTEGTADDSLTSRLVFQSLIAEEVLSDPVGLGLGSTGRAAVVDGGNDVRSDRMVNFDSGIFEPMVRYGALGGLAILGSLFFAVGGAFRRARRGTIFDATCAASLVALLATTPFLDIERGMIGLLLWTLVAVAGRVTSPGRRPPSA